jgi:hypothetical protein
MSLYYYGANEDELLEGMVDVAPVIRLDASPHDRPTSAPLASQRRTAGRGH